MKIMHRKSQSGLSLFFVLVILGLIYFAGLAGFVGSIASAYIITANLTGLDAWFYANINFVITLGYILALMAVGYFGLR